MDFIRKLFKPKFKQVCKDILGLDIDSKAIKWVVLAYVDQLIKLKDYAIAPTPINTILGHRIHDVSQLAVVLKQTVTSVSAVKHCVLALPDFLLTHKCVQIEGIAYEGLERYIDSMLEVYIPYPRSALYFDYRIIAYQQGRANILLVACRKEYIDIRLNVMDQAGLIPIAIESGSQAIARAYHYCYASKIEKQPLILLDLRANCLTLLLIARQRIIANYSEEIIDNTESEVLFLQVKRCVKRYCLSYPYYAVTQLFMTGFHRSLLQNLCHYLNGLCGLNPKILEDVENLFCFSHLDGDRFKPFFPSLFLGYGLALRPLLALSEGY